MRGSHSFFCSSDPMRMIVGATEVADSGSIGAPAVSISSMKIHCSTAVFSIAVALASRWYLEHRGDATLRNQVLAVSVSSVATVVVGTLVAARLMFISVHDLNALLAVLTIAVAVSVASSFQLASRFQTDARAIGLITEQLVARPLEAPVRDGFGIKEMRDLARRLEEVSAELEHSRDRERALEVSRRELVSWVSHDLRSPLATIRALAEALEDGIASDEDERSRYLRSILRESERLTVLVDDLFELSRIQAGTIPKARLAVPVLDRL
jgi:signal transduction histidine kinase